jgi:hypothetical protein
MVEHRPLTEHDTGKGLARLPDDLLARWLLEQGLDFLFRCL